MNRQRTNPSSPRKEAQCADMKLLHPAPFRINTRPFKGRARQRLRDVEGAQLLEFALALPILLILLTGILDFGTAYNMKQKLNNAAREGARLGASQNWADVTQTNPPSIEVIRNAVVDYLKNSNLDVNCSSTSADCAFIGSTMTPAGAFAWTYYTGGNNGLKIERAVAIPATGGGNVISTRVTLTYPYNWTFGFDRILRLLVPSTTTAATVTISTDAVMENLN